MCVLSLSLAFCVGWAQVRKSPAALAGFAVEGVEPGQLVAAVSRLGMFADTESARRVGNVALNSGAAACVDVVQSALQVARLRVEVRVYSISWLFDCCAHMRHPVSPAPLPPSPLTPFLFTPHVSSLARVHAV
jgi:hypothetical protein